MPRPLPETDHETGALTWLDGDDPAAGACPVCADAGPKARVVGVRALGDDPRELVLVRCPACTVLFFPALRPLPFCDAPDVVAEFMFEAAVGLRGSIECLAAIPGAGVTRFLEVGCGTGLTLDWARHVYGWDVLGVDDSVMAARATAELGVPVVDGLLGHTDAIPDGAWDVVFACEVLEHVVDQYGFLVAVRRALTPAGTFLLRTPAAEAVTLGHRPGDVLSVLSPGYHALVHTTASLEHVLRTAGFTEVHVHRRGDTLHAAAATVSVAWDPEAVPCDDTIAEYLRQRTAALPAGGAARLGLLQQLVNLSVNRGDRDGARAALVALDGALRARHGGAGLDADAGDVPAFSAMVFCDALVADALLAQLDDDDARAEQRYAAAVRIADEGLRVLAAENGLNPGLTRLHEDAARARFGLVAARDGEEAARLLPAVLGDLEAGAERVRAVQTLFVTLVGRGASAVADALAVELLTTLGAKAPATPEERSARWALAMHLLHHAGDHAGAAAQFAIAAEEAQDDERREAARFHLGYTRWHAGDRDGAAALLRATVARDEADGPGGPAAPWAGQAHALLTYAG